MITSQFIASLVNNDLNTDRVIDNLPLTRMIPSFPNNSDSTKNSATAATTTSGGGGGGDATTTTPEPRTAVPTFPGGASSSVNVENGHTDDGSGGVSSSGNNEVRHVSFSADNANNTNAGRNSNKRKAAPPLLDCKRFGVLLLFLIVFPIFPLAISTVFGGLLALVENATFLDGFLYVASNLLAMSEPLTDFNPNNAIGVIIDVYVSIIALLTFGIILNIVNLFQVPLAINRLIEAYVTRNKILVPMFALVLVIPVCVAVNAVVFGSILGAIEGWDIHDGILYVFSNLLGLGTPLTDVLPTTIPGDILDIIISSMALGCVAVFVDYVTVLNPARYIRKRAKEGLERRGIVRLSENRSQHPLAYLDDEDDDMSDDNNYGNIDLNVSNSNAIAINDNITPGGSLDKQSKSTSSRRNIGQGDEKIANHVDLEDHRPFETCERDCTVDTGSIDTDTDEPTEGQTANTLLRRDDRTPPNDSSIKSPLPRMPSKSTMTNR